jgi:hypothetical protein
LASATRQDLARQIQFLKTENQTLRSKLSARITFGQEERRRLVQAGQRLGAQRGKGSWDELLKTHGETFWQCDFPPSKKAWTLSGLVDLSLLVFIHTGSRRVWISPATQHPDRAWVARQARNLCMHLPEAGLEAKAAASVAGEPAAIADRAGGGIDSAGRDCVSGAARKIAEAFWAAGGMRDRGRSRIRDETTAQAAQLVRN